MPVSINDVLFDQTSVPKFDGNQKSSGNSKEHFPMKALFANTQVTWGPGNSGCINGRTFVWRYSACGTSAGFDGNNLPTPPYLLVLIKGLGNDQYDVAYGLNQSVVNDIAKCKSPNWSVKNAITMQIIQLDILSYGQTGGTP